MHMWMHHKWSDERQALGVRQAVLRYGACQTGQATSQGSNQPSSACPQHLTHAALPGSQPWRPAAMVPHTHTCTHTRTHR